MTTKFIKQTRVFQKRQAASRRLDEWKRRNAKRLKRWNPLAVLRLWREKRWSSSTHR